jgi:multidrug efflux system membrane fusion protein
MIAFVMPKIPPSLILIASLALVGACSRSEKAKGSVAAPVLTAKAVEKTVPLFINPPPVGHIMPLQSVTIRPQIGGAISAVGFQEGQEVRKGDLLFTIDPRPAQAALTLAKGSLQRDLAQLENARIQFERDQKLFEQKLISQDVFDTSKAAADALKGAAAADRAAVTNAELNLQYTEIRSPIDGRTGSLAFHEGNVVKAPDDVLLTINQIHPIYATFAVPERYLPDIQQQMRSRTLTVTASYENLVGAPPAGELTFVDNAVDEMTGTILLKAKFPNTDSQLWPGQFVTVALQLNELTNAVVVPSQAVQMGQAGQFIFVVKADQTVEVRVVKTLATSAGETTIISGLRAGETVVTDGQLRLAPGMTVSDKGQPATKAP